MITKPEEAVPIEVLDGFNNQILPMFTAAECAEIAKAYADDVAAYVRENNPPEIKDRLSVLEQWRAKFAEWEQMK